MVKKTDKKDIEVIENETEKVDTSSEEKVDIKSRKCKRLNFNLIVYPIIYIVLAFFVVEKAVDYIREVRKEKSMSVSAQVKENIELNAKFFDVSGVELNAPIYVSGVQVGFVKEINMKDNFFVDLVFQIDNRYKVPADSYVRILTDGVFGAKYLAIEAGDMDEYLEDGDSFEFVEDSIDTQGLLVDAVKGFMKKAGVDLDKDKKKKPSVDKIREDLKKILEDVNKLEKTSD